MKRPSAVNAVVAVGLLWSDQRQWDGARRRLRFRRLDCRWVDAKMVAPGHVVVVVEIEVLRVLEKAAYCCGCERIAR